MAKYKAKGRKSIPTISTASLPDIVFILLFFFMVIVTIKEHELKLVILEPAATEGQKLMKKSLVSHIYVGEAKPKTHFHGTRIQLNDQFAVINDIPIFIAKEVAKQPEVLHPLLSTSIHGDQHTEMGIISDIKQKLRKSSSLKLNYSTREKTYY